MDSREEITDKLLKHLKTEDGWRKFQTRLSSYKAKILADDWDTLNLTILLDVIVQYYKIPDDIMADYTSGSIPVKLRVLDDYKEFKGIEEIIQETFKFADTLFNTYRLRGDWIMRYAGFFAWWITSGDLEYLKMVYSAPYESQDPLVPDVPWCDEYEVMFG